MTKAKELATIVLDNIEAGRSEWQEFRKSVWDLCDAVLSEPDEPEKLKGWIECTSTFYDNDRVVLINIRDISSIYIINDPKDHVLNAKTGICLRRSEEVYYVKESYDELKQKIKEAS